MPPGTFISRLGRHNAIGRYVMQKRKLIGTREVAENYGLSRREICELVKEGRLPVIRLRKKKLLFEEEQVAAAIKMAETPATGA
jgi:excisionase family DNA binding protein